MCAIFPDGYFADASAVAHAHDHRWTGTGLYRKRKPDPRGVGRWIECSAEMITVWARWGEQFGQARSEILDEEGHRVVTRTFAAGDPYVSRWTGLRKAILVGHRDDCCHSLWHKSGV